MLRKILTPFALLLLSACAYEDALERAAPVEVRHPITVEPRVVELRLVPDPGTQGLSPGDNARLAAFAREFRGMGSGTITASTPDGSGNSHLAVRALSQALPILEAEGVSRSQVALGSYPAPVRDLSAPIIFSYMGYVAAGPECGDWSEDYAYTPNNTASPNFGCATQRNLAAAVADPRDLLGPRSMDPADAARRAVVLDNYRKGEVTAATKGEGESGTVSDVAQQ